MTKHRLLGPVALLVVAPLVVAVAATATAPPASAAARLTPLRMEGPRGGFRHPALSPARLASHPFLLCIQKHESRNAGRYLAKNRRSTASGAYQFLDGTWRWLSRKAGFPGYRTARSAPPSVQDQVAWYAVRRGWEDTLWAHPDCNRMV